MKPINRICGENLKFLNIYQTPSSTTFPIYHLFITLPFNALLSAMYYIHLVLIPDFLKAETRSKFIYTNNCVDGAK
jgi:hypothetical protein